MEVIIKYSEVQNLVAAKHNVRPENVIITFNYGEKLDNNPPTNDFNSLGVVQALMTIFDEGKTLAARNQDKYVSKIALVKAIRTLTNANLKEAKDLADNMVTPF
jgi:hypothetical protein